MMKKVALACLLLLAAALGYCALPLISVSSIRIAVFDETTARLTQGVTATFVDDSGAEIVTIESGKLPSWDNVLEWWAHSAHDTSLLRPADAKRAAFAIVRASGCAPVKVPVKLTGEYNPPSPMPHGGGPAFMYYQFSRMVTLTCGEGVDTQTIRLQEGEPYSY